MTDANQGDLSDAPKILSDDGSVSEAGLLQALAQDPFAEKQQSELVEAEEAETTEEVEEPEVVNETESQEEESEESSEGAEKAAEEDGDVLSQIDVDDLSIEDKIELAKLIGSDVGQDNAKVRRENAMLKKELESYKAQIEDGLSELSAIPQEFKGLNSTETLDEKSKEWRNYKDQIDDMLVKTDEEFEINGDWVKRETLAQWGKHYGKLLQGVPEYRQKLKDAQGFSESKVVEKLKADLPDIGNEDSEFYKKWRDIVDDPQMKLVKHIAPKQFARVLELAAHSVAFKDAPKSTKKLKLPLKKPKNIGTRSNAAKQVSSSKPNKAREAARERIQSGEYSEKDLRMAMFGS